MSDEGSSDTVVRLAATGTRPHHACTTCMHYHPRTDIYYGRNQVTWHWTWPWRRISRVTDSGSFYNAVCSFYGGHTASSARELCGGDEWEPRP